MGEFKNYISEEELEKHKNPGDLWISIQGKIYNVSNWAKDHPGGEFPLVHLAGKDVTDSFIAFHPGTAWHYLDKFFTGYYLKDYSISEVSNDYRKLVAEFTKMGLFHQKGHITFVTLCAVVMLFSASVYGVLYCNSTWVHVLCGSLIGCSWIQLTWIGHDSAHYQFMSSSTFHHLFQILIGNCFSGVSIQAWKLIHNPHHIACNSLDFDPDMQHLPFFALSSEFFNSIRSYVHERNLNFDSLARLLVSYQQWTFYPIMCFARTSLFVQSFSLLFSKRRVPNRCQEILGVVLFWIWYPLLVSCLPNWKERVMFVIACFGVTGIQQVQFSLNHFSSHVYLGPPNGNDWFEKQTKGTLDIKCSSWMDWFHGGLQFQIEHHLFPRLPRCNLRKISPFVIELCKKHKLPYKSVSFWKANEMTLKTLRTAALQARDLTNPIPKNLVWEAVNTQG
ncbi:acyl-lipid (9-3)-desaturase-like [Euphorbia lathyris]|uniref:acyl-lipid (9-3)-desaturase-like n=1 Tax=Euphorbia lathyris TaxID=212925 RepID=UPI0033136A98